MEIAIAKKRYSSALHALISKAQRDNNIIERSENQSLHEPAPVTEPQNILQSSTPTLTQLQKPKPDQVNLEGVTVKHSNNTLLPTIEGYSQLQTSIPTWSNRRPILPNSGKTTEYRKRIDILGPGWPRSYVPRCHRPWQQQHPSIIATGLLIETCAEYKNVFPNSKEIFEPANMPWWTLWLVAFAARQTTLKEADICLLYKYKYKDVVPSIEHMDEKHTIELWNFLNDGEHQYAFEWDRSEGYEDALKMLLDVWLGDAHMCEWRKMAMDDR